MFVCIVIIVFRTFLNKRKKLRVIFPFYFLPQNNFYFTLRFQGANEDMIYRKRLNKNYFVKDKVDLFKKKKYSYKYN